MEQEDKSEIADQVSEFRKEALNSTDNIAEISKALKEALDNQSLSIGRAEDEIAASSQSEETQASTITGISNSLSDLLGVQKEILDSLKGLNRSIENVSQQQGDSLEEGGGANPIASSGVFSGGSGTGVQLASFGGGNGGGGGGGGGYGGYGGGGGAAPSIPKGEMAETLKAGIVERLVSDEELAVDPEKAEMIAEAFVMNFNDESGLDPNDIERVPNVHGTRGKGLYQLTDTDPGVGRRSDYEGIYGDDYSIENQLDFLVHELKTSENSAWSKIKDSETVGEAASKIVSDFLRPAESHKIERSNRYSGDRRTTSDFDGVVETPESIDGALTPLTLNWGGELPENITEGSNEITLTDPVSGEEFSVNFEVENVDGNLASVGPVTLAQDTDLEGVSGDAGDPVEVSAEIAQDLADQIGATIESSDLETPADLEEEELDISDSDTLLTPEETPADLEELDISNSETLTPEEDPSPTDDLEELDISNSETLTPEEDPSPTDDLETPADLEELDISNSETLTPEVTPTPIDLGIEPTVVDNASTTERNVGFQEQPSRTAAAYYSEGKPNTFTGEWKTTVELYYYA